MDWKECINKRIVKDVKEDKNLILSTREIAEMKIQSAEALADKYYIGKITLLYDALRESLEALALEKGYKIYNHECYTSFLKEVLHLSYEADLFDKLRKIRNGINYYGKKASESEAKQIILDLHLLIRKFKK
ncbi:hypothetical protein HZA96_02355 [Candidatus Woesearchaeota archaeon]|nr:hypothetical protein [Candidatus Woesearchaeota archaeon]